jgi:excisionase family DNA binding protein
MDKSILDVKGAASLLGVSTFTVYRLVAKNLLPAAKVGRQYRFHRSSLLFWIAESSKFNQLESLLKTAHIRNK